MIVYVIIYRQNKPPESLTELAAYSVKSVHRFSLHDLNLLFMLSFLPFVML
ncbi:hypothetical protein SAMN05192551_103190 [Tindallia magadiensis]|uniref:Uncharacterized protein n=1 Tax=Tindallia magadiensis TaxID=69895 RepID=A0A1I3D827_9FIRM|nr:hypothetical protein SAMN05192551_103190 [Tindallia magadiensis]